MCFRFFTYVIESIFSFIIGIVVIIRKFFFGVSSRVEGIYIGIYIFLRTIWRLR